MKHGCGWCASKETDRLRHSSFFGAPSPRVDDDCTKTCTTPIPIGCCYYKNVGSAMCFPVLSTLTVTSDWP